VYLYLYCDQVRREFFCWIKKHTTCIDLFSDRLFVVRYYYYIIIVIIHAFIMHTSSVVVLNQRRWQSLGGQHGKGVDGLFEKVSFQTYEIVHELYLSTDFKCLYLYLPSIVLPSRA